MFCRFSYSFFRPQSRNRYLRAVSLVGHQEADKHPVGGMRGINGLRITIDGIQKLFPEVYRRKFAENRFADSEKTGIFENTFPKFHTPTKFVLHFAERALLRNGARSFGIPICGHIKSNDRVLTTLSLLCFIRYIFNCSIKLCKTGNLQFIPLYINLRVSPVYSQHTSFCFRLLPPPLSSSVGRYYSIPRRLPRAS